MESNQTEPKLLSNPNDNRLIKQIKMILAFKYAKNDSSPSEIFPYLYLGSVGAAMHKSNLQSLGITHVLSVADNITPRFPDLFTYKCIDFLDTPESDLLSILPECFDFIEKAAKNDGKVLLHCFAGKSRSASVCIAFLMRTNRVSLLEAFKFVRERRTCAMPNTGFMRQLKSYEEILINTS